MAVDVVIYHNPECGTSRNTLAMIRNAGIEPHVPLVVTPLGVRLCRPSEAVLDILPEPQQAAFAKEDGEQVVDAAGRRVR